MNKVEKYQGDMKNNIQSKDASEEMNTSVKDTLSSTSRHISNSNITNAKAIEIDDFLTKQYPSKDSITNFSRACAIKEEFKEVLSELNITSLSDLNLRYCSKYSMDLCSKDINIARKLRREKEYFFKKLLFTLVVAIVIFLLCFLCSELEFAK